MSEGKTPLVFSSFGLSPANPPCQQQAVTRSRMLKGDRSERRSRTYRPALEAPLNQHPRTVTGRLIAFLLIKQYRNFILQFFSSAFLYSEIRAKICSGLGKFENTWRTQVDRPALPREDRGSLCPSLLLSPLSFGLFTPFYKPSFPG